MKTVVAVLAVVAMVAEAYIPMGPPMGNGVRGRVGGRVVGGRPATATEAPWQISLNSQGMFGRSHICGGSLRDPNYVITAAHCCDGSVSYYYSLCFRYLVAIFSLYILKIVCVWKFKLYL